MASDSHHRPLVRTLTTTRIACGRLTDTTSLLDTAEPYRRVSDDEFGAIERVPL
ncbi:hypothetical protein ACLMAJ_33945 [Nocardia sp. KC 131]|uniref:hypothetical protein n=1 Tax=Nocardia arseniciresistens TaxID=3392119 RepID=UPI00398E4A08